MQAEVGGTVDSSHGAATDKFFELILTQSLAEEMVVSAEAVLLRLKIEVFGFWRILGKKGRLGQSLVAWGGLFLKSRALGIRRRA